MNTSSNRSRGFLYAVTNIACLIWLITSVVDFNKKGTITHWSSILFIVCIVLILILTAWQTIVAFYADVKQDEENGKDEKNDTTENSPSDNEEHRS